MLVYLKESMGCSTVDGYKICGKYYAYGSFGPANIPRSVFIKNKDILEEVEMSQKWLYKKTGEHFPLAFKTSTLRTLDFDTVIAIAKLLGIKYIKGKKNTVSQKAALRRAIIRKIDAL